MGGHHSLIYSVPVTHNNLPNETEVYRHYKTPEKLITNPPEGDIETIQDLLLFTKSFHGENPCLGKRNKEGVFEFESYNVCLEKATWVGSGIINMGLAPGLKEFKDFDLKLFGIFSKNSVEYVLLDMAASLFGFTSVPIYDTLGQQAVNYILDQTNVSTIFSSQANVDVLLKLDKFSGLKNVVCLDGFREDQKEKLKAHGLMTIEFSEVMENGKNNSLDYPDYSNETISTFSYTSGTTGDCFNNIK